MNGPLMSVNGVTDLHEDADDQRIQIKCYALFSVDVVGHWNYVACVSKKEGFWDSSSLWLDCLQWTPNLYRLEAGGKQRIGVTSDSMVSCWIDVVISTILPFVHPQPSTTRYGSCYSCNARANEKKNGTNSYCNRDIEYRLSCVILKSIDNGFTPFYILSTWH